MTTTPNHWTSSFGKPAIGIVLALALLSISISWIAVTWILPLVAFLIILATPWSPRLHRQASPSLIMGVALAAPTIFLLRGPLSLSANPEARKVSVLIGIWCIGTIALVWHQFRKSGRITTGAWAAMLIWIVAAGTLTILADPQPWIDVWYLHKDAANALENGVTPYAGRELPNEMAWFPEGNVFEGYVYPPVILSTYAVTDLLTSDSRWMTILAGVAVLWALRRLVSTDTSQALAVMLLMSPGWALMVQLAWTEGLSVALLAVALTSSGRFRSILIGIFLASKQYLLAAALPLSASWLGRKNAELLTAGGVAIITLGVGAVFGPQEYFGSAFLFHINAPTAYVGSGLPGLSRSMLNYPLEIHSSISLGVAVIAGWGVARLAPRTDGSMILASAITLALLFFLGSQAFPNYWYQVFGMLVLGTLTLQRENPRVGTPKTPTPPAGRLG